MKLLCCKIYNVVSVKGIPGFFPAAKTLLLNQIAIFNSHVVFMLAYNYRAIYIDTCTRNLVRSALN